MLGSFHHDISKSGFNAEFKYVDSSEEFYWVIPGEQEAFQFDTIKAIIMKNGNEYTDINLYWDHLELFSLTHHYCNYTGVVKGSMKDSSGIVNPVNIIETGTIRRNPSGWELLSGQSRNIN